MNDTKALDAEFTNGEVRQFTGRAGQTFDYIEDETVMDRLDEVLGKGNWSIQVEPISVADGIVKVSLSAFGTTYEDFGYANNLQGDALKEAVSDGIRRCGRYLGVARYLYKKHAPTSVGRAAPPPARPVAARTTTDVPEEPDWMDAPTPIRAATPGDDTCPEHDEPWKGEYGDRYHKKAEGGYCRIAVGNVPKAAGARR
jgi:hypothetical protein